MRTLVSLFKGLDIYLVSSVLVLTILGLVTMYSYQGENLYFSRQVLWIGVAFLLMLVALIPDYRFLRVGNTTFLLYLFFAFLLVLVLFIGEVTLGAQSRFNLGFFSLQPADPAKLILIAVLAKCKSTEQKNNREMLNLNSRNEDHSEPDEKKNDR